MTRNQYIVAGIGLSSVIFCPLIFMIIGKIYYFMYLTMVNDKAAGFLAAVSTMITAIITIFAIASLVFETDRVEKWWDSL